LKIEVRLRDERHNRARDQTPTWGHAERKHGLQVQDSLSPAEGPDRKIPGVLKRHVNHVGQGILHSLLQPFGFIGTFVDGVLRAAIHLHYQ
jgi:hypothetical protein